MNSSLKRKLTNDEINDNSVIDSNKRSEKAKKRLKTLIPDYSLDDSEYYIENGLRKVYPYYYTYYAYCKGRWVGLPLDQFYSQEFRAMSIQKTQSRIENGLLLVNNKKTEVNYILKPNDVLSHRIHRHEMPVMAAPIRIIHLSEDMLVIDKPPSIPVHPCGKYRLNSITSILEKEHQISNLHTVHRLDRLTSGVMIFGRTVSTAQKLHEEIRNRTVSKEYVCRVDGLFPDGVIVCKKEIQVLSHKIGICIVSEKGKCCETSFEKLNYNGKSSTVLCKPKTGRMHQIRVHLQYLGFPIVNDYFYNNHVFGPKKGKDGDYGKTNEILIKDIESDHLKNKWIINSDQTQVSSQKPEINCEERDIALKALEHYTNNESWISLQSKYKYEESKQTIDKECDECVTKCYDPIAKDSLIYLHALKYKGLDWEYESSMPVWAQQLWNYD